VRWRMGEMALFPLQGSIESRQGWQDVATRLSSWLMVPDGMLKGDQSTGSYVVVGRIDLVIDLLIKTSISTPGMWISHIFDYN
jgi:hypothetical protein